MPIIKATMFMSLGRFAWTESHWSTSFAKLDDAGVEALVLAKKRTALFGAQTALTAVRLSAEGVYRDSYLIDPAQLPANTLGLTVNAALAGDNASDVEDVALIVRAESGVLHRKSIYLRGNPDIAEGNAFQPSKLDLANATFVKAMNAYFGYLTANWGFFGRDTTIAKVTVSGIIADAAPPTVYGVQVLAGTGGYAIGDFVQLSGFSVTKGQPAVNGIYQVAGPIPAPSGGLQTYWLRNSLGINPAAITKAGTVQKVVKDFLPYTRFVPRYVKRRATGGRTGLPLGRRKIRASRPG